MILITGARAPARALVELKFLVAMCSMVFAGEKQSTKKPETSKQLTGAAHHQDGEIVAMFWAKDHMIFIEELGAHGRNTETVAPVTTVGNSKNKKSKPVQTVTGSNGSVDLVKVSIPKRDRKTE